MTDLLPTLAIAALLLAAFRPPRARTSPRPVDPAALVASRLRHPSAR